MSFQDLLRRRFGIPQEGDSRRKTGEPVQWVASNCGCGDDVEVNRQFQMPGCKYFEMITITDHPTPNPWKLWLKLKARKITYYFRARKYRALSAGSEVVNFQQTLNAYGSTVLFHWLNQRSQAARVVTIHELDRHQLASPESNKTYNKADAIIVQQGALQRPAHRLRRRSEEDRDRPPRHGSPGHR